MSQPCIADLTEWSEVIVIGGGMAGLFAARALAAHRPVVIEAEAQPGGRTLAHADEVYWRALGAHMVGGPDSRAGKLITALGVEANPIRGRLAGLAWRGRRLLGVAPESYLFRLPMNLCERVGMLRVGIALRAGAARYAAMERRAAAGGEASRRDVLLTFDNDRTLAGAIGPLPPGIAHFLEALTERTGAHPAAMSAGHGFRSFANVWTRQAPGRHIRGGTARLAEAMAAASPGPVLTRCHALDLRRRPGGVAVTVERDGCRRVLSARALVLATPPDVAKRLLAPDWPALSAQLGQLRWGSFLSAALATTESGPMPWDGTYAIATPDAAFSVVFDMASSLRDGIRLPGGSLMLFRGARSAEALLSLTDTEIEARFRADLQRLFPESAGHLGAMEIRRWPMGAPHAWPGSAPLVTALGRPEAPVALAGDYLEFPNIESALASGERAAAAVSGWLRTNPSPHGAGTVPANGVTSD